MKKTIVSLMSGVAMSMTLLATAGHAQDAKPVAKIGDVTVTDKDLDRATTDMGEQFARIPEGQRRAAVLDALIDIYVLAAKAKAAGLDKDEDLQARLELLKSRALHNRYFQESIEKTVTDEQIKARYEEETKNVTPQQEIRARHILVKTEDEAKAIIKELEGGADFEELAKSKSTGPSGPKGGDLGFFAKGQMVPEFEQAAFALDAGGISKEPVKTQFGFHVIKVEEKRDRPLPTLESQSQQIRQLLLRDAYTKAVDEARKEIGVEILDPALQPKTEEQPAEDKN